MSSQNTSQTQSYVNVAKSTPTRKYPKREQAIVLDVADLHLFDYVIADGSIIGPKNIVSASKIANNRICIYLTNVETVNQLVKQHQHIEVQDQIVKIRRYIAPYKRILISN